MVAVDISGLCLLQTQISCGRARLSTSSLSVSPDPACWTQHGHTTHSSLITNTVPSHCDSSPPPPPNHGDPPALPVLSFLQGSGELRDSSVTECPVVQPPPVS